MSALKTLSADEVIHKLGLEFLEGEGVWIRVIWRTPNTNAIQCLLTPQDFSGLHLLREDEAWVHVAGAPVEMLQLHPDGSHDVFHLGTDIDGGECPAVLVPAGSWQGARTKGPWSLVVCTLAPPFTSFILAGDDLDLRIWPGAREIAQEFIRG
jgi:predicted cupin superfamily sugar epimerase